MYASPIIERAVAKIEAARSSQLGRRFRLIRFPEDVALEMIEQIEKVRDHDGRVTRDLTPTELSFIENELTLSAIDFRYWATRYAYLLSASREGGLVRFKPAGSQELLLERIAILETAMWDAYDRGLPIEGICLILHKARQLGATAVAQILLAHRDFFLPGYRAITGSIDDELTQRVHSRFTRIYDNLPWWMAPAVSFRTKERGMRFGRLDSVMELQDGKQSKGFGQGENWDGGHLTECASWPQPGTIEHDFFPTCTAAPSLRTLVMLESTAQGRDDWWFDFTEQVRSGTAEAGSANFNYTFIPYYAIDQWDQANGVVRTSAEGLFEKYRRNPPVDWVPSDATRAHAMLVEQTSPEWMGGRRVVLDREVLYWYETTRAQYYRQGRLNSFLTNYCATPEESFQHAGNGAFTPEQIETITLETTRHEPMAYRLMSEDDAAEVAARSDLPVLIAPPPDGSGQILRIGPVSPGELDRDPRGIIYLWELPRPDQLYYLGADPSGGVPRWDRSFRQKDDINIDNAVIEVFRRGRGGAVCEDCKGRGWVTIESQPGLSVSCTPCDSRGRIGGRSAQVAEFAGPIDAEDFAPWVAVLGRLYAGACGFDECLAVVENNNTGLLTIRTLIAKFGYSNLFRWQTLDGDSPKFTSSIGWASSAASVPILHSRSRRVIVRRDVEIRSRWLAKELSNAVVREYASGDRQRFEVPPGGGRHDDRMSAAFFCFWGMFSWTETAEDTGVLTPGSTAPSMINLAATDCTVEEMWERWNESIEGVLRDDLDEDEDQTDFSAPDRDPDAVLH